MDIPESAAQYYDLSPEFPRDIPFYEQLIPSAKAWILELGCGTGRVLVPLSRQCGFIYGLDSSQAMLARCAAKLEAEGIPEDKATIAHEDITSLRLRERFDQIIAPFRVFQNLTSDEAVRGYFDTVRDHLAPGGSAIVNTFRPSMAPDEMRRNWCRQQERLRWEVPVEGGKVTLTDRRTSMDRDKLIIYPDLIYRRYKGENLVEEAVLSIVMRCYYPDELVDLVKDHGFQIIQKWGGYRGETYGEGPELIIQFGLAA